MVFLSGAGSGIGRAVCQVFAREGAALAAVDINKDSANQTIDSLPQGIHYCRFQNFCVIFISQFFHF